MKSKPQDLTTHLQTLINTHADAMILATIEGKILAINDKAVAIFQQPIDTLLGESGYNLVEMDAGERRRQVIHQIITTRKPQILVDHERNRWWKTKFIPILENTKPITTFAVIIQDMTTSSEKTTLMEQNEEFYQRLIQYSTNIFTIIDEKGIIRYNSKNIQNILGRGSDLAPGTNIFRDVHPKDIKKVRKAFDKALKTPGSSPPIQYRIKDATGSYHHLESQANNLLEHPIIKGIIVTTRDISTEKRTEEIIQHTQEYLQEVLYHAPTIFFTVDQNLKIKLWNSSAEKITGYPSKEIVGKPLTELPFIQNIDNFVTTLTKQTKLKYNTPNRLQITTKKGSPRVLALSQANLKDEKGQILEYLFSCTDITPNLKVIGYLEHGESYLLIDNTLTDDYLLFTSLSDNHLTQLLIARTIPVSIFEEIKAPPPHAYLISSLKQTAYPSIATLSDLYIIIKEHCINHHQSIILLDRIDYFIINQSFETVLSTLYHINEEIQQHQSILLLRISSEALTPQQLALLKEEFSLLQDKPISELHLDGPLRVILDYVKDMNAQNIIVSYKKIQTKFKISKMTTQKRLEQLINMGLIHTKKSGRAKHIFLTYKGKKLLIKRTII
ncbi:MAG: PAS domain S-box protein [Candidatus Thermoplasmatota archaeon]|nr:PAS domain S-box protein [Candidatus Thermoplasmatota archaeon]MBU1941413.1 PAS domain S-box protein [Candidatus Thermoplasmatota archaeon]